jgi:hypothetical protein
VREPDGVGGRTIGETNATTVSPWSRNALIDAPMYT